jgi:ferritin
MNMLISEKTAQSLEKLMGMFFQANRIMDRMSTQLSIKFVMPNTSQIVHKQWAHKAPLTADLISDYCDERNYPVSYPTTVADYTEYSNLLEMFNKLLDFFIDIEGQAIECYDIAQEEHDIMTKYFVEKFLYENVKEYTKFAQNMVDYVEKNGDEPIRHMSMDARIGKFLGVEIGDGD